MPATWGYRDIQNTASTWGFGTALAGILTELDLLVRVLDDRYSAKELSDKYRARILEDRYKVSDSGA